MKKNLNIIQKTFGVGNSGVSKASGQIPVCLPEKKRIKRKKYDSSILTDQININVNKFIKIILQLVMIIITSWMVYIFIWIYLNYKYFYHFKYIN